MTAVCGGGTSSAKAGFGESLYVGPAAIAALLNNIPTLWAVPLAGLIGHITYQLSQFCPNDPPAVPSISAAEVRSLLDLSDPVANIATLGKFQALVGAYLWYQVCQCDTVTTPAPPAAPAAPVGMPTINPQLPGLPVAAGPCLVVDSGQVTVTSSADTPLIGPFGWPPGATGYRMISDTVSGGSPSLCNWPLYSSLTPVFSAGSEASPCLPGGAGNHTESDMFGAFTSRPYLWLAGKVASGTLIGRVRIEIYCNGAQPNSAQANCGCPPDPLLAAQVARILDLVTTIQRQSVPFGYIRSTVHAGLHDNGELVFTRPLIGALVQLTATPAGVGLEAGDPLTYWEAGWFNWGNLDGFSKREHISASPQVSLPAECGQYTRLGYSLTPGVTATITELVREP